MKRTLLFAWIAATGVAACGDDVMPVPADVLDRETFIATYVDLRLAAIADPDFALSDSARAEVLRTHGVDEERLLRFADAHGRDVEYMNAVWTEIDTRIEDASADDLGR